MSTTKFTPADAARAALDRPGSSPTPAQARTLDVARCLWCREAAMPTVRQLAAEAGLRSPSTILKGFGRLVDLYAQVVRTELDRLRSIASRPSADRIAALAAHGSELSSRDRSLVRLPVLVLCAVDAARPAAVPAGVWLGAHVLAALADPSGPPLRSEDVHGALVLAHVGDESAAGETA
jgi:hypothetical protein